MAQPKQVEQNVAMHYDGAAFEAELTRLPQDCPVEMEVTLRRLARVTRAGDVVAEIGVGSGHCSDFLARRGSHLHLVDISSRLLDAVQEKLRQAGLDGQIVGHHQVSGVNLEAMPAECVDVVLLMGPLYHLHTLGEGRGCVEELARILKPSGALFATGINRLAYFRDLLRMKFAPVSQRVAFHHQYLRDGNVDPETAPPLGYGHLSGAAEFLELFEGQFEKMPLWELNPSPRRGREYSATFPRRRRKCNWIWWRILARHRKASDSRIIFFLWEGNGNGNLRPHRVRRRQRGSSHHL
jgi:2-polyprenyl-3-methyl-5-hydroxy-6-metoxy-1,4-benzoquinol methylase